MLTKLNANDVTVIAPNLKYRLSGVTSTVVRLVPLQSNMVTIAATGPALPADIPQVSLWSLFTMSRSGPEGWRIWHARRNIEMFLGIFLRRVLGKRMKLIFTSASQRQHSQITRTLIRSMDAVVATSEKSASYLEAPAEVIYHGIDTQQFCPTLNKSTLRSKLGLPVDGKLIGCFGRIRHQKGTDLFIETAISLCKKHHDLYAVVLGRATAKDSSFVQTLKERIEKTGMESRVLFFDEVMVWEMADWYKAIDVYVAPQRWEGFGLTPLEAMACSVPVVAADVGAFSSLIINGATGFIVPPNSQEALMAATDALLTDSALRNSYGAAARAHTVLHFDIVHEAESLVKLYQRLMS